MAFKVFCAETSSAKAEGKTFFQGWTKQFGMITVFNGTRKTDGKELLIVNIARPWRKRRLRRSSRRTARRSNNSGRGTTVYQYKN